jgi:hypothetical protein
MQDPAISMLVDNVSAAKRALRKGALTMWSFVELARQPCVTGIGILSASLKGWHIE